MNVRIQIPIRNEKTMTLNAVPCVVWSDNTLTATLPSTEQIACHGMYAYLELSLLTDCNQQYRQLFVEDKLTIRIAFEECGAVWRYRDGANDALLDFACVGVNCVGAVSTVLRSCAVSVGDRVSVRRRGCDGALTNKLFGQVEAILVFA